MSAIIRPVSDDDATELANIYSHYITNSYATFETEPVAASDMAERVAEVRDDALPWLVAEESGQVVGFSYASKWQGRCAYRYSVEGTVYVDATYTGKGVGSELYSQLLDAVRDIPMHAVIGGIALPNDPCVRLHERLSFEKVGHFAQVGYKFNRWIDVGYWQLML